VIDDRSTDATPEILSALGDRVSASRDAHAGAGALARGAEPCRSLVVRALRAAAALGARAARAWRPGLRRAAGMGGSPHWV
jgi:hypothetical protein